MSKESAPDQPETYGAIMQLPYYVDPAVLRPGAVVYAMLGDVNMPLTVQRVEPYLVCTAPDGTTVILEAHLASLQP